MEQITQSIDKASLLNRVLKAKEKLPVRYWPLVEHFYPEESQDKTWANRLKETSQGRSMDPDSVLVIESIAERFKNS